MVGQLQILPTKPSPDPDSHHHPPCLSGSNPNGHAYEHRASARRAHGRTGGLGTPPTRMRRSRGQRAFQSRRFFTSRHSKLAQFQSFGHERGATLPFTLEVRPVTGGLDFQALIFHFEPGEFTFELLNARVQSVDLRPVTGRSSGGQRLVLNLSEIDGDAHLSIITGPSRQPQTAHERPSGLWAGTQPAT